MLQKRKQKVWNLWLVVQLVLLMLLGCLPVTVQAAGDVQFTKGKYGQNCLSIGNCSTSSKNLDVTQNIYLDAAARKRADQGELTLDASVRTGANGSRTNSRKLEVKCFNQNGAQVGSTWKQESESYSVKHNWNNLSVNGRTLPKGTYRIQYYVHNHIGTKGDLEIQNCSMTIRDNVKPSVANITAATDDGRSFNKPHPAGTKVTYTVHFSERVTTTGTGMPQIEPQSADTKSGSVQETTDGGAKISYTYIIPQNGTVISDNHRIALKSISSFTIKDDAGNSASVSLTEDDINRFNSSLTSNGSLFMDNRPPELIEVTSEGFSKNSVLCVGDTIRLHLNFHENIKVTGNPSITFSNGKTASYIPTKTTTSMTSFTYTVGKGDDVNELAIQSFQLGGIVDGVNQEATASTKYAQYTGKYKGYLNSYSLKIDTLPPTAQAPDFDETWLSRDQVVTVSASDDREGLLGSGVKYVQYAWSGQAEKAPQQFTDALCNDEGLFEVKMPSGDGNWYLWLVCQDMTGNTADPVCSTGTAKLDVTPPEIKLTKKEIGEQVVSVAVEIADSVSGVAQRSYAWYDKDNKRVAAGVLEEGQPLLQPSQSGTYLLKIHATDVAGNTAECEQEILVDCTPPTVSISCETEGYAREHQMQVACSDELTVVEKTEYQWKEGNTPVSEEDWKALETEQVSSPENADGEWCLYIRATDAAGNQTVEQASCLLDNTAPEILIVPDGNEGNVGKSTYPVSIVVNDSVTAKTAIQVEYGCSTSENPDAVDTWTKAEDPENIKLQVTLTEDTYVHVKATDEAGNTGSRASKVFALDKKAPEGKLEVEGKSVTNSNTANIRLIVTDDCADSTDTEVQLAVDDGPWGTWEKYEEIKVVQFAPTEGEHTVRAQFKDIVGNVSEPVSTVIVYDITPPVITLEYSGTERTNKNITVKASLSDGTWLSQDTYEFTANGEYLFEAVDEAGNTCGEKASVTWIDKTPPEFSLTSKEADARPHKKAAFSVSSEKEDLAAYFWRVYAAGTKTPSEKDWKKLDGESQELPELEDGSYIIEVCAEDDLGNRSVSRMLTVTLDNTPPKASVSYAPEKRTSENVTATLSLEDDSAVSVTSSKDGSFTHVFKENGSHTFTFTDAAGNTGSTEAGVDWIDRSLPKLETEIRGEDGELLTSGEWTAHPVTVALMLTNAAQKYDLLKFNGQDIMGEQIRQVKGIEPVANEADTYRVTTYGVLEYQITDTEIDRTSSGSLLLAVDTKEPFCKDENVLYSTKNWTNQDVTVRIKAEDDLAKNIVYLEKYKTDGGSTKYREVQDADTFVFTENGKHTFYFKDEAGNVGSHTVSVDWIDKKKPEAKAGYKTADGETYDPENWTNQDVKVSLSFDSASPVELSEEESSYLFTANGSHTFTFTNAAGNQNTFTVSLDKIDKVAPVGYMTASVAGWTNTDVEVTLHATDEASGAEDMQYTFTENGEHTFALKDHAGNTTEYTYVMQRIDKEAPQIELYYTPGNVTKTPFSVFVSATANESVSWDKGISSWKFADNGEYIFTAKDRAGNTASATAMVDWISPDLPEVQLKYSTTDVTAEDVRAELCTTDPNASVRILNNNGSRFYTFRENGVFTFKYTDAKGLNTGTITAKVDWIDKEGPALTVQTDRTELGAEPVKVTITANEPVTWPDGVTVLSETSAEITYTDNVSALVWAQDALGNRGYAPVEIGCIDHTAPEILMERTELCIPLGQAFDPLEGVEVQEENPDATPVQVEGSVDVQKPGRYSLVYKAVDTVGNASEMKRTIYVYDPEEFQVIINREICLDKTILVGREQNQVELIHAEGNTKVKVLKGKASIGEFKLKGNEISEELLQGSYVFTETGYFTLYVQDQERNEKLVQIFVTE